MEMDVVVGFEAFIQSDYRVAHPLRLLTISSVEVCIGVDLLPFNQQRIRMCSRQRIQWKWISRVECPRKYYARSCVIEWHRLVK